MKKKLNKLILDFTSLEIPIKNNTSLDMLNLERLIVYR